jgi:LmbE family N-acetylglucosaminyl deacetylase
MNANTMSVRSQARAICLLTSLLVPMPAAVVAQSVPTGPLRTPAASVATEYQGAAALGLALRRLGTAKRVLMIAAHPDDENTQIISTLALGQGAEVAYLSLTRGEGGQNGIGPELQDGLGLLRTEELLAARRLDGARQYFTRAYDYGYSKNVEEALGRWPREELLADVVAVIREFRPDIIISIFSGTPADGHGQHHAAGLMAQDGFAAAADRERFTGEQSRGLPPHAAAKLYQALWRGDADAPEWLETGVLDPLLGRSHYQVAMASRSRHRSQDMGRPEEPGPRRNELRLIDARDGFSDVRLFAGVDTLPSQRARTSGARNAVAPLQRYEALVARVRAGYNPLRPDRLVPDLVRALDELDRARGLLTGSGSAAFLAELDEERLRVGDALTLAAGIRLDGFTDRETIVPGATFEVTLRLWNGGDRPVRLQGFEPRTGPGWAVEPIDPPVHALAAGALATRRFRMSAPASLQPSEPYFLREERDGDLYRWPQDARAAWGASFEPPLIGASARIEIDGARIAKDQELTFRGVDLRSGEYRRPLRAVPAVSLLMEPELTVMSAVATAQESRRITVRVVSESPNAVTGMLRISAPPGWRAEPANVPISWPAGGGERAVDIAITPAPGVRPGDFSISASFSAGDELFDRGYTLIDYPHISPRPLYRPARTAVHVVDVRLPAGLRVGYVAGAGAGTPAVLEQLGVSVRMLGTDDLATADLSGFDAIVTGIRAYEVRPDLVAHNQRLLDYVRRGGTMVVQYNKYEYLEPGIAPFPVQMARPHDRITDADAPVTLLEPGHAALSWPNRITARDFDGWVQERGLYHLRSWDDRFTPLLAMADPGEEPQHGSLLVARHGDGIYVYTGLAFFRQLPAGVHGAYRLFANLISLGTDAQ